MRDIVIIGGGPGGYVAAIRAAQLGAKVSLVEERQLGGTCLNRGCIPTKALYRNAQIINLLNKSSDFGIHLNGFEVDINKVQKRKQEIVDKLVKGVEQLLKANKVEVIIGKGVLKDKNTVSIILNNGEASEIKAHNIIIATGSTPILPNIEGIHTENIFTTEEMLNFTEVPEEFIVVGGGVVGMEFACIMNSFGSKVTVVEFLPNILTQVDLDVSKRLKSMLKRKGINILTSTKVTSIKKDNKKLIVNIEDKKGKKQLSADKVLISTGRRANLNGLNLENIGVLYDKKSIKVDDNYETNIKDIYAIGDVNGKIMLAHAVSHQGIRVVEKIMGINQKNNEGVIPSCIFTFPEIAFAGMTENEAKKNNIDYVTNKFMFGANGKALTLGESEGFVKVLSKKEDNTIIGVHILGAHASDLISEGVLAIDKKLTADELKYIVHAHPTLSESFHEAVLGILNEGIHTVPKERLKK